MNLGLKVSRLIASIGLHFSLSRKDLLSFASLKKEIVLKSFLSKEIMDTFKCLSKMFCD